MNKKYANITVLKADKKKVEKLLNARRLSFSDLLHKLAYVAKDFEDFTDSREIIVQMRL